MYIHYIHVYIIHNYGTESSNQYPLQSPKSIGIYIYMLKAAWLASNTFRSGQMFVNSRTAWLAKMEGYVMLRDVT